ncbi:MAG: GAF domain-containing protein [Anaerolineae bacterium]|nr:GAF domain-containing protein [Anaerolineae bacterium]
MKVLIKKLIAPPIFDDEEKTRIAVPLNVILWTMCITSFAVSIWIVLAYRLPLVPELALTLLSNLLVCIVCVGLWWLLRQGHVFMVGALLSGIVWSIMTAWIYIGEGIRNLNIAGYFLAIIIAGLILGGRAAILSSIASICAIAGAYWSEMLTPTQGVIEPFQSYHLIMTVFTLGITGLLLRYYAQSTANSFAQARENANTLRSREQFLLLLMDITRTALETLDSPTMLKMLANRLVEVLEADGCFFTLWDEATQRPFSPSMDWGKMWHVDGDVQDIEPGVVSVVKAALGTKSPVMVEDVNGSPYISESFAQRMPAHSLLILPLIAGGQKLGAVAIGFNQPHLFTLEELDKGEQAAKHIALAIAKARLVETLHRRNTELTLLNVAGQELTAMLDFERVTEQLLQAVTETIGAESASVWLWDESDLEMLICRAVFRQDRNRSLIGAQLRVGQGVAGWVAQTGESTLVPRVREDARFYPGIDQNTGFETQSLLTVPLRVRGAITGVLQVVNKNSGQFDKEDLSLVETLAASAAIAIDNARLMDALRQRTVELEIHNKELDAFAHTVAHDLKNPLTSLVGYSEFLATRYATIDPDVVNETLQTVARNGRKMTSIINALLLLASVRKMEEVAIDILDMEHIVAEVLERLASMITEYQVKIILPETWPIAMGYAAWIEEVWANYVSNAIKYGGRRDANIPPQVEFGAMPLSSFFHEENISRNMIRFWVKDNGPGLTSEAQARLFTKFERLGQIRIEGHGLGLSIVRRIVEKLGGQVGVESEVNVGSLFWFTLPAYEKYSQVAEDNGYLRY